MLRGIPVLLLPLLLRPRPPPDVCPLSLPSAGQSRAMMALKVLGRSSRHHDCHAWLRLSRVRSVLRNVNSMMHNILKK